MREILGPIPGSNDCSNDNSMAHATGIARVEGRGRTPPCTHASRHISVLRPGSAATSSRRISVPRLSRAPSGPPLLSGPRLTVAWGGKKLLSVYRLGLLLVYAFA